MLQLFDVKMKNASTLEVNNDLALSLSVVVWKSQFFFPRICFHTLFKTYSPLLNIQQKLKVVSIGLFSVCFFPISHSGVYYD